MVRLSLPGKCARIVRGTSVWRQLHAVSLVLVAAAMIVPPARAADAPPLMTVPGSFAVSPAGAATYSIPIQVPPGTAGMVPSVSLNYSSQGRDGIVGWGWALSYGYTASGSPGQALRGEGRSVGNGTQTASVKDQNGNTAVSTTAGSGGVGPNSAAGEIPMIVRCPRTKAQDTIHGSVNYDSDGAGGTNDRFCMFGQRLMVVSGGYGATNSVYHTEIESFTKVTASSTSAGNGPTGFEVQTRDGTTLEFGYTTDSRLLAVGKTTARAWALDKVIDRLGNYFTVTYTNDASNGELYPSEIDYTGNGSQAPYNSVRFVYESRGDVTPYYQAGSLQQVNQRLKYIETCAGACPANLVSVYILNYRNGTSTTHSRITSVSRCSDIAGTNCLATTTFGWQGGTGTVSFTQLTNPAGCETTLYSGYQCQVPASRIGDFNGDGLTDFVITDPTTLTGCDLYAGSATGTLTLASSSYWCPTALTGPFSQATVVDINGDGLPDFMTACGSTGNYLGFVINSPAGLSSTSPVVCSTISQAPGIPAPLLDRFTGSGKTDLLIVYPPSSSPSTLYASNGDGTFASSSASDVMGGPTSGSTADFDGSGCADRWYDAQDLHNVNLFHNTIYYSCNPAVPSFSFDYTASSTLNTFSPLSGGTGPAGDVNGDGKTDFWINNVLYLSTGTGYVAESFNYSSIISALGSSFQGCYQGDFDGDGRTDLLCITSGTPPTAYVYLSTGTGFTQVASFTIGNALISAVADWNGDGATDFWAAGSSAYEYLSNYVPEYVTSISNGIGATTTITYDRLNKNGGLYTKGSGASYPVQDVDNGMYVVSQVQSSNGLGGGGNFSWSYSYAGAKQDLSGRGFLGFTSMTVADAQSGIVTTSNYHTDFPYIGMLATQTSVTTSASAGCTSGVTLKTISNTYATTSSAAPWFVYPATNSVVTHNDCDGTALPTVTTTNHFDCQDTPSACYGDLKIVTTTVSDGSTETITNAYHDDTTHWCLGELTQSAVTRVVGSSTLPRTSSAAYDATSCEVTQTIVEPGSATLKVETDYSAFDAYGHPLTTQVSGSNFATRTTHVAYDSLGEFATSTTDALGHVDAFTYDARFGAPLTHTDPNGVTTSWSYDTFGRWGMEVEPDGTAKQANYVYCQPYGATNCGVTNAAYYASVGDYAVGGGFAGPTNIVFYDTLSRPVQNVTQGFNGDWVNVDTQYDTNGHILRTSRPYDPAQGGTDHWTNYSYDALGRVTDAVNPNGSDIADVYQGLWTYQCVRQYGVCQESYTARSAQGFIITAGDAAGGTTHYVYDAFGSLLTVTDNVGNVTTNSYDTYGRRTQTIDPDMGTWTYGYDGLGELTSQTDAKSQTTTLNYDLEGRLIQRIEPDLTSTWSYGTTLSLHNNDKLVSTTVTAVSNAVAINGDTRTYSYDSLARPVQTVFSGPGYNFTFASTYSVANGKIATVGYPSGFTAQYLYNTQAYLYQIKDNASSQIYWTANSRDAELHLTSQTQGDNVTTLNTFNADTGLMSTVRATYSPTHPNDVASFDYYYDLLGNLTSRDDGDVGTFENYCYDPLNRLTNYSVVQGTGVACNASGSKAVGYDALGDITSKSDVGTYSYPAAGQVHPHAVSAISGSVNGFAAPNYSYDADGNMTYGEGRTITYTSFNMAKSVVQGANTMAFYYDTAHQRFAMSAVQGSTTTTTYYLNDPASGAMEELLSPAGALTWRDYIQADGQIVAERFNTSGNITNRYFTLDNLGSVAVVADDTGNPASSNFERNAFDPWGKPRNINGSDDTLCTKSSVTTRGFTNQEEINALCAVNLNARIYEPAIGRFMVADDVVPDEYDGQSLNRYAYVDNRPLDLTDPTGRTPDQAADYAEAYVDTTWGNHYSLYETNPEVSGMRALVFGGMFAPKCNIFIYDSLRAGSVAPNMVSGHVPTVVDWNNGSVGNYRQLTPDEALQRGDVLVGKTHMAQYDPYELSNGKVLYSAISDATPDADNDYTPVTGMIERNEWGHRSSFPKEVDQDKAGDLDKGMKAFRYVPPSNAKGANGSKGSDTGSSGAGSKGNKQSSDGMPHSADNGRTWPVVLVGP